MNITPRNANVLVKIDSKVEKSGEIYLAPQSAGKERPNTGVIQAVGPSSSLTVGARVMVFKHAGIPVIFSDPKLKTDDLVIFKDEEIIATLSE